MKNEKLRVPKLRFKEFSGEWKEVKLCDIVEIMTDYVAAGSFESLRNNVTVYDKSNYALYIRLTDLRLNIYHNGLKYVDKKSYDFLRKSNLYGGEILIANIGANVGDTYLMPKIKEPATIAPNMIVIRENNKKFISRFLFYWLNTVEGKKSVNSAISGSGQPKVNKTDLKQIKVVYTIKQEQEKIASFLSSIDKKINQLSKKDELLQNYKKSMMQKIFSQKLRFKKADGNDYPKWEEKKLNQITKVYDGTHNTPKYVNLGVPFYSVEHVTANQFKETKYISEKVFEKENERVKLEKNDILMTRIGDIGTSRLIDWDVRASFYVSLALIKNNKNFSSSFLNQFIKSDYFQRQLYSKTLHVAFPKKINLGEIGECLIKLPFLEEQIKIANFLSSLDTKISQNKKALEETQKFKKALLQKMFV